MTTRLEVLRDRILDGLSAEIEREPGQDSCPTCSAVAALNDLLAEVERLTADAADADDYWNGLVAELRDRKPSLRAARVVYPSLIRRWKVPVRTAQEAPAPGRHPWFSATGLTF